MHVMLHCEQCLSRPRPPAQPPVRPDARHHPQENQTKEEGQIHFFPVIFNGQQLYKVAKERLGPSATTK